MRAALTAILAFVMVAAVSVALPATANAQGPSATIGSYTIPDVDGSTSTSLSIDTGGVDLQAVGITVGYDAALVEVDGCESAEALFACNTDEAGVITIEAVNPAGWGEAFTLATIDFTGLGSEGTAPLTIVVDEAYDSDLAAVTVDGVDGSITVSSRAPSATVAASCVDGDGQFTFELDNPMDDPVAFTIQVNGSDEEAATLQPGTADTRTVGGVEDGAATVTVLADGAAVLDSMETVTCDPEVDPSVTCGDGDATIVVDVTNYTDSFATYRVIIGSNSAQQRSISAGLSTQVEGTVTADGPVTIVAERNGEEIHNATITVDCGLAGVAPTPVPPTPVPPTPVPPTPIPDPGNGGDPGNGDNQGVVEVGNSTTCLAQNGRVDTNIVNTGDAAAMYRIEFQGLSARQTTVAAGDWWRMPITGRADGDYNLIVKRDGAVVSDTTVTVACDTDPPNILTPEVQVVNACRAGNGYILFQFANNSDASKSYIIEFEGVQNRSTSAAAYGGAVRAVTGRQSGEYSVHIRNGNVPLTNLTVTVDC